MGGFSFQLEGQDLFPEGLNANKRAILCKKCIWVEKLILHTEHRKMLQKCRCEGGAPDLGEGSAECPRALSFIPSFTFWTARCRYAKEAQWRHIQTRGR